MIKSVPLHALERRHLLTWERRHLAGFEFVGGRRCRALNAGWKPNTTKLGDTVRRILTNVMLAALLGAQASRGEQLRCLARLRCLLRPGRPSMFPLIGTSIANAGWKPALPGRAIGFRASNLTVLGWQPALPGLICLLLSCLLLSGCGRGSQSSRAERPAIAVVPMGTTDEYWKTVHAGAVKAGRQFGVQIIWQGPIRRDDRSAQIDVVENMIVRHVNGIVVAPVDNMALRGPVEDAFRNNIPVVVIDSDLQSDKFVSFVATDNYKGGQMAGEHLAKLLAGKGKVAMLRNVEGNASTDHREEGFLAAIAQYTSIAVVSSNQHAGSTSESAYRASENLLAPLKTTDGKLTVDGIFCPNESSSFGMLRALQDAGLAGKVHFIGFDSSQKLTEAVQAGVIDALVVQNPMLIGYLGVKTLLEHTHKQAVPKKIDVEATLVTRKNAGGSREAPTNPRVYELLHPDLSRWLND